MVPDMAEFIKAFVSSTFDDLEQHRARVIEQIRNLGVFVDPMENWFSSTEEPKEFCLRRLDGCQLCILLVAFRRGFIPPNETVSITQMEYQEALERNIVVLPFMLRDDVQAWAPRFCENDPGIRLWRDQLQKKHGVGWFTEKPESLDIAPSVTRWLLERPPATKTQPPARAIETKKTSATTDERWHDLGDFSVRLQGLFDSDCYPPANKNPIAHLLLEAEIRRNNLATSLDVPAEIGLILDVSGSMRKENRYGMLEQAVAEFFEQMGAKDRASVVIFSTTAEVISGVAPAHTLRRNVPAILERMQNSSSLFGLKTNIVPALNKAIELFQGSPTARETVKRIYVLTDGGFHDANAAKGLLPKVVELGAEIGIYGFGTEVDVDQLKRLLRGQRGGWVKPIVSSADIVGSFAHIAEVNKALVGQEGRLFIDFDKKIILGEAWAFRPHEQYFGPINKHRGNCNVGAAEANRVYSMLFEIGLPTGGTDYSEPVARIGFVWRNGKQIFEYHRNIEVTRKPNPFEIDPDEATEEDTDRVRHAFVILDALRRKLTTAQEDLQLQCAKLQIAEYEGRSPDLIRAIQKKIASLRIEVKQGAADNDSGISLLDDIDIPSFSDDELQLTPAERLVEKANWDSEVRLTDDPIDRISHEDDEGSDVDFELKLDDEG